MGLDWQGNTHPFYTVHPAGPSAIRLSLECRSLMMSCGIWTGNSNSAVHLEVRGDFWTKLDVKQFLLSHLQPTEHTRQSFVHTTAVVEN